MYLLIRPEAATGVNAARSTQTGAKKCWESDGSAKHPFRSLERAQAGVRQEKESVLSGQEGYIIFNLLPGFFRLNRTLQLTELDSGAGRKCLPYGRHPQNVLAATGNTFKHPLP